MKWKSLRQGVPAILFLALLALFGWGGIECVWAGEKREIVDPGINASLKVMNGTPWVMPPEVEALFPKDAVFDERLLDLYSGKLSQGIKSCELEKVYVKFSSGMYEGVCSDFIHNINLHGGMFKRGCIVTSPHPQHPNGRLFADIKWESIDPRDNVHIIKYYIMLQSSSLDADSGELEWKRMAKIVLKFLKDGHGIVLRRATIGFGTNNTMYTVHSIAFPLDWAKTPDGTPCYLYHMFIYESNALQKHFNLSIRPLDFEFFIYDGKLYLARPGGIFDVYMGIGNTYTSFGAASICSFE